MDIMPKNYLVPEVRDGEFIDEKKKKLFKVLIDIIEEIKLICEKNDLRYYAAYGTLLGAVRHKGFVPWDDDVDLWMPRKDFEKFQQIAPRELPSRFFMQTQLTDPEYDFDIIRIRDNNTTQIEDWRLEAKQVMNYGIWVSIFPLDGRPNSEYGAQKKLMRILLIDELLRVRKVGPSLKKMLMARLIVMFVGEKRLLNKRRELLEDCPFESSERCTPFLASWLYYRENLSTKAFSKSLEVPFEYTTIRIPYDYDELLTTLYGDWRIPVRGLGQCHATAVLEPDIPWKEYLKKIGWKI